MAVHERRSNRLARFRRNFRRFVPLNVSLFRACWLALVTAASDLGQGLGQFFGPSRNTSLASSTRSFRHEQLEDRRLLATDVVTASAADAVELPLFDQSLGTLVGATVETSGSGQTSTAASAPITRGGLPSGNWVRSGSTPGGHSHRASAQFVNSTSVSFGTASAFTSGGPNTFAVTNLSGGSAVRITPSTHNHSVGFSTAAGIVSSLDDFLAPTAVTVPRTTSILTSDPFGATIRNVNTNGVQTTITIGPHSHPSASVTWNTRATFTYDPKPVVATNSGLSVEQFKTANLMGQLAATDIDENDASTAASGIVFSAHPRVRAEQRQTSRFFR